MLTLLQSLPHTSVRFPLPYMKLDVCMYAFKFILLPQGDQGLSSLEGLFNHDPVQTRIWTRVLRHTNLLHKFICLCVSTCVGTDICKCADVQNFLENNFQCIQSLDGLTNYALTRACVPTHTPRQNPHKIDTKVSKPMLSTYSSQFIRNLGSAWTVL